MSKNINAHSLNWGDKCQSFTDSLLPLKNASLFRHIGARAVGMVAVPITYTVEAVAHLALAGLKIALGVTITPLRKTWAWLRGNSLQTNWTLTRGIGHIGATINCLFHVPLSFIINGLDPRYMIALNKLRNSLDQVAALQAKQTCPSKAHTKTLTDLRRKFETLQTQLKQVTKERDRNNSLYNAMLKDAQTQYQQLQQRTLEDIETFNNQIQSLQRGLGESQALRMNTATNLRRLQRNHAELNEIARNLRLELQQRNDAFHRLIQERDALRGRLESQHGSSSSSALEPLGAVSSDRIRDLENQIALITTDRDCLNRNLQVTVERFRQAEGVIAVQEDFRGKNVELEKDLIRVEQNFLSAMNLNKKLQQDINHAKAQIEQLQAEVERLNRQVREMSSTPVPVLETPSESDMSSTPVPVLETPSESDMSSKSPSKSAMPSKPPPPPPPSSSSSSAPPLKPSPLVDKVGSSSSSLVLDSKSILNRKNALKKVSLVRFLESLPPDLITMVKNAFPDHLENKQPVYLTSDQKQHLRIYMGDMYNEIFEDILEINLSSGSSNSSSSSSSVSILNNEEDLWLVALYVAYQMFEKTKEEGSLLERKGPLREFPWVDAEQSPEELGVKEFQQLLLNRIRGELRPDDISLGKVFENLKEIVGRLRKTGYKFDAEQLVVIPIDDCDDDWGDGYGHSVRWSDYDKPGNGVATSVKLLGDSIAENCVTISCKIMQIIRAKQFVKDQEYKNSFNTIKRRLSPIHLNAFFEWLKTTGTFKDLQSLDELNGTQALSMLRLFIINRNGLKIAESEGAQSYWNELIKGEEKVIGRLLPKPVIV